MTAALRLCLVIALAAAKPLSFCDRLGYLATNATHRRLGAGGRGQQHVLPEKLAHACCEPGEHAKVGVVAPVLHA